MGSEQLPSIGAGFVCQIPVQLSGWVRLKLYRRLFGKVKPYPQQMTVKQLQTFVRLWGWWRIVSPSPGPDIESFVFLVSKKRSMGLD